LPSCRNASVRPRARSFASLSGSFATKRVRGADYWYFKTSAGAAGQREYFVGRDDPPTRAVIKAYAGARAGAAAEQAELERLCAMLRQGGAQLADAPSARVIAGLANAGVFRLGGVLVGTHAFIALANVLGVRWRSSLHTQDVDVAVERVLEIAVPQGEADLPQALDALNMGFLPVPGLNPKAAGTSFKVRGQSLRVDLLTPARGPRDGKPVYIPRLKAAAQPLELLDYLLESALPAPLVDGGASLVNVPNPARFALHKLALSGRRPAHEQPKARKDKEQAAELLEVLFEDRRGDLRLALRAFERRGTSWTSSLRRAAAGLQGETLAGAKRLIAG
jgi:hypothetical protein